MNPEKLAHLSWVRGPIVKYIERCKETMVSITSLRERISSPPAGAETVWFVNQRDKLAACELELTKLLSGITAALDVVKSDGGYTLASEVRTLASVTLSSDGEADLDKALLAIQGALNVLPSYLSMVIDGAHDSPGVLLKYINELRALRGVPAISDESALPVNLSFHYVSPPLHESDCDLSERERIFKKAATSFCQLYSQAMKESGETAWSEMRDHLRELQRVTNDPELGCNWWVGEAIIDVIIADGCYFPPAMTAALRVVMVATQRLPQGEDAAKQTLSPAKFSSLLNALSISRKKTNIALKVIEHFDVKQNVEEGRINQLQEQLATQSVQSISDVVPEIKPRLESAMIAFGRAVNSKSEEAFTVQTQAFDQAMRTIANIFGIFNEDELSELSFYLADAVKSVSSPADFTPEVIENVKTQILYLDSKLVHLKRNEAAVHLQIENVTADVIDRIALETSSELKKVSHMIATHLDSGVGSDKLLAALDSLRELANVYEFAGSLTIANILAAIVTVISDDVKEAMLIESDRLPLAAKALVSVEMYLQYITNKLQPPASLIEVATGAVRDMGLSVSEFRIVSHSDLLAKFEADDSEEDGLGALIREIFEVRSCIEEFQKEQAKPKKKHLSTYATACLRLSTAAVINGEKKLADLCRHSAELANIAPGRMDDPSFDYKRAVSTLGRTSETILRCMDEYSSKGKINLFLVDLIREVAEIIGHTATQHEQAPAANPEPAPEAPAVRELPPGYDPQLQALFNEEFAEQIAILREYLANDNHTVTERECRAIHNIHGCSGSASCIAVSTLFDVLESRFYALKAKEDTLTAEQVEQMGKLLNDVEQYQREFPWVSETSMLPTWLSLAGTLIGTGMDTMVSEDVTSPSEGQPSQENTPTTIEAPDDAPVAVTVGHSSVEEVFLEPTVTHDDPAPAAPAAPVSAPTPATGNVLIPQAPDYNLEDADLYLCDADDVIPELQRNISEWMLDMNNRELIQSIRRNMHTLKGASSIISANGIRTLTHNMETLFDSVSSGAIAADQSCVDLTHFVLNELITMSDAVRSQQPYRTLPTLNDFIINSCDMNRVDGDELAQIIAAIYGAPAAPSAPEAAPAAQPTEAHQSPAAKEEEAQSEAQFSEEPVTADLHISETTAKAQEPAPNAHHDEEPDLQTSGEGEVETESGSGARNNYRGYRGKRGRAEGERQKNYEARIARKNAVADGVQDMAQQAATVPVEPDYTDIETPPAEMSRQVVALIEKANQGDRDALRAKKKNNHGSEKIKVELQLLDNSVKLSNELKASSYRQNTLHREMLMNVVALREKLSLHLMHSNKMTVQLRHFNNMTGTGPRTTAVDSTNDEQRLYLERFNHLSHSQTHSVLQIEQILQDAQDVITQWNLLESGFKYQGEVVASLQRDLLQSRLVMFDNERPSINGAFTSALQMSQKKAQLQLLGTDTRIDRQLLESIRDPLRHVVTNSVAHGIETEAERIKAGKPALGNVTVKATRRARTLVIEVSDDGRGIDPTAIRKKAISLGLIREDDSLDEHEVVNLITESGFSTAKSVSELSGRGVGMDIVRNRIGALGGHLRISSELGKGTTIELELPLTVGSNRALVCKISDQWFAIPTFNMTQVLDYPTTDLLAIKAKPGQARISFDDKAYDIVHLADLMAVPDLKLKSAHIPSHTSLVLVEQGNTRLAIEVERGISMPEIHVTKFEGILSSLKGIIGSTEVHDGTPALVLDVIELARLNLKLTDSGYKPKLYRIRRIRRSERPLVLIVDDASSFQKLFQRHFKSIGWDFAVAHDGKDALDKLQTLPAPSLFLVDVEMPRMNGLELTERLRSMRRFDDTPIIMVTTRSSVEDEALKLGVNKFLSKPVQSEQLTEAVLDVCPEFAVEGAE